MAAKRLILNTGPIEKEQKFLASLQEEEKRQGGNSNKSDIFNNSSSPNNSNTSYYAGNNPKSLSDSIMQAVRIQKNNTITEMHKAILHITKHNVMSQQDMLKQLKGSKNIIQTAQELVKACRDHYSSIVTQNINLLLKGKPVKVQDRKFSSPVIPFP